jgi:hypothetical protein
MNALLNALHCFVLGITL